MVGDKYARWVTLILSWIIPALTDPFEYSECVRPLNEDKLKNDVITQFKVYGLVYDEYDFNNYLGNIIFAVNVASF